MTSSLDLAEAEAAVADQRRALAGGGLADRSGLAKALLRLAQARLRADLEEAALAAAEEGVAVLSPAFLDKPARFAVPMRALLAEYVAMAQRLRRRPDEALLAPVAQALGTLTRAEDEADDEAGDDR